MKLVAFLNKPNDEAVIEAAVEHFRPEEIRLFLPTDNARLDEATVLLWSFVERRDPKGILIKPYEMNTITAAEILGLSKDAASGLDAIVALPTSVRRAFMDAIPLLRRSGIRSIEIPDGLNSAFGLLNHSLAIRLQRNPITWLKTLRALVKTPGCVADFSFFPFYPLNSFLARTTFPSAPPRIHRTKSEFLKNYLDDSRPLLVGLEELSAGAMAEKLGIKRYLATCKEKNLIVDGRSIELPFYLCAEEVLASLNPLFTIGYASNAVVMAKKIHPERPVCLLTGILDKCGFPYYEKIFARLAAGMGVVVLDKDSIGSLGPNSLLNASGIALGVV